MTATSKDPLIARKGRFRRVRKLGVLATQADWRGALRKEGVAAAIEHRAVPFPDNYATVIDVGAHHGQFSLFARHQFPGAAIYCVEPLPDAGEKLKSVFRDDANVTVLPYAASTASGVGAMQVSKKTDSSSLLKITDDYVSAFPGTELDTTAEVETRPLDEMLPSDLSGPILLKIDAQGGELDVLAGAAQTLRRTDAVFVECSFIEFYEGQALADEVIEFLRHNGMRLSGVFSVVRSATGQCLQADLLFARDEAD